MAVMAVGIIKARNGEKRKWRQRANKGEMAKNRMKMKSKQNMKTGEKAKYERRDGVIGVAYLISIVMVNISSENISVNVSGSNISNINQASNIVAKSSENNKAAAINGEIINGLSPGNQMAMGLAAEWAAGGAVVAVGLIEGGAAKINGESEINQSAEEAIISNVAAA